MLVEFLIENQLFADAAEGQKLGVRRRLQRAHAVLAAARAARRLFRHDRQGRRQRRGRQEVSTTARSAARSPRRRCAPAISWSRARKRPASCSRRWRTAPTFAELAKENSKDPGSQGPGRRARLLLARPDGAAVRGGRLQAEEGRGQRALPDASSAGTSSRSTSARRRAAPPFEAVKDRVVAAMIHQKAQQIAADLRGKAQIEYIDPEIKSSMENERAGRGRSNRLDAARGRRTRG